MTPEARAVAADAVATVYEGDPSAYVTECSRPSTYTANALVVPDEPSVQVRVPAAASPAVATGARSAGAALRGSAGGSTGSVSSAPKMRSSEAFLASIAVSAAPVSPAVDPGTMSLYP